MAWLRILSGHGEGATFDLGQRTFTLGRSPGNLVQVVAPDISRRHCQFRWDGSRYTIQDLNSENGVLVNGLRVGEQVLADGDRIAIGETVLQFRADDALPGAVDPARRWNEMRAELTGGSTATLDQAELSGMLGALRQGLGLGAMPAAPVPAPPPPAVASGQSNDTPAPFPEAQALAFLAHLRTPRAAPTLAAYLGEVATGAGRLLGACRVSVLLRRVDATGAPRLAPALTWVRPDLPPEHRAVPVFGDVVRQAVVENAAKGAWGSGPGAPVSALAAPMGTDATWYGILYVDSFAPPPGPFRQAHLDFLAALAGCAARFLSSSGKG